MLTNTAAVLVLLLAPNALANVNPVGLDEKPDVSSSKLVITVAFARSPSVEGAAIFKIQSPLVLKKLP